MTHGIKRRWHNDQQHFKTKPYYKRIRAEGVAEERARQEQFLTAEYARQEQTKALLLQHQRKLILTQAARILPQLCDLTSQYIDRVNDYSQLQKFIDLLLDNPEEETMRRILTNNE